MPRTPWVFCALWALSVAQTPAFADGPDGTEEKAGATEAPARDERQDEPPLEKKKREEEEKRLAKVLQALDRSDQELFSKDPEDPSKIIDSRTGKEISAAQLEQLKSWYGDRKNEEYDALVAAREEKKDARQGTAAEDQRLQRLIVDHNAVWGLTKEEAQAAAKGIMAAHGLRKPGDLASAARSLLAGGSPEDTKVSRIASQPADPDPKADTQGLLIHPRKEFPQRAVPSPPDGPSGPAGAERPGERPVRLPGIKEDLASAFGDAVAALGGRRPDEPPLRAVDLFS